LQPLFTSIGKQSSLQSLSEHEYDQLLYMYRYSKSAQSYLADYDSSDVVKATLK
jgi:hypothetical protein